MSSATKSCHWQQKKDGRPINWKIDGTFSQVADEDVEPVETLVSKVDTFVEMVSTLDDNLLWLSAFSCVRDAVRIVFDTVCKKTHHTL